MGFYLTRMHCCYYYFLDNIANYLNCQLKSFVKCTYLTDNLFIKCVVGSLDQYVVVNVLVTYLFVILIINRWWR
jgi:hypothetical protein